MSKKRGNKKKYTKKELELSTRVIYLFVGLITASLLIVFSFRWEALPIRFTITGVDVTSYVVAPIIVLVGVLASTLTKSAFTGKYEIDS